MHGGYFLSHRHVLSRGSSVESSAGQCELEQTRRHGSEVGTGVVRRIVEHARRTPDALAVSTDQGDLTYRALVVRAFDLSARLRAAGVSPDDLVALCVPRSADLVVGALGILAVGAGYVALDPDQPGARLRFMIEDCTASVLVAPSEIP